MRVENIFEKTVRFAIIGDELMGKDKKSRNDMEKLRDFFAC